MVVPVRPGPAGPASGRPLPGRHPPTIVHVFNVCFWFLGSYRTWEPPASLVVLVLPRGVPHDLGRADLIDSLRPYEHEPTRVELLFRPYPELRDLDVVADRHGRHWAFCAPWWWVELDRDDTGEGLPVPLAGPAWPRGPGWRPPRPWDWNTRACRDRIHTNQWTIRTASAPTPAPRSPA